MEEFTICSNVSWLYHFLEQKLHLCSMLSVTSYQARLCSGDGFSVSLPAHLLLASSWVARNTFILEQAGQDVFLPSVRGSTLLLLVEILRSGKTSNLGIMDNLSYRLKEVQEVMMLLDIPGCIALTREDGSEMKIKLKIVPKYQVRIEKVSAPLVSSVNHAKEEISCTLNPVVKVTKIKGMPNFLESGPSPLMLDNQDYTEIKVKGEEYIVAETSGLEEDGLIHQEKENVLPMECHVCKNKYWKRDSLKRHIRIVHRDSMFPCEDCAKKFIWECNLKQHVIQSHQGNRINCDHCKGTYRNKETLGKHMRSCHKDKLLKCKECNMHFFSDVTLKIHVKNNHSETPYDCGECSATFCKKAKVRSHMRNVHSGVLFVCEQCRSTFGSKATLNRHMKNVHKHTGDICDEQLDQGGYDLQKPGNIPSVQTLEVRVSVKGSNIH